MVAYRFVFQDLENSVNFLPPGVISPARFVNGEAAVCCSSYALSMYESLEQLTEWAKKSRKTSPMILKRIGDHVAHVRVTVLDGKRTRPNSYGHFDFFESVNFVPRSAIVGVGKLDL